MQQRRNLKEKITDRLERAGESMPLQPLVELCADRRVWIENHKGVTTYHPEEICVAVRYGYLQIRGQGLRICRMEGRILVITGRIESIHIQKEGV